MKIWAAKNMFVVESSKGLKLKDNEVEWLLEDLFDPLDFLSIMGYSNDYEDWREYITLHVTSFIYIACYIIQ
jgi:hypothetical protein